MVPICEEKMHIGLKGALALPQVANEPPPAPCFSPGDFAKARARGSLFFGGNLTGHFPCISVVGAFVLVFTVGESNMARTKIEELNGKSL